MLAAGSVQAQTCTTTSWPSTLANNTLADATQVMNDLSCAPVYGLANWHGNVGIGTTVPTEPLDVYGPSVFGASPERLSLNSGSVGFNRRVENGQIFNSSAYAFQFQHWGNNVSTSDILELAVFSPSGATITNTALVINGVGQVAIGNAPPVGSTNALYVFGSAYATGGFSSPSDARMKTNITEIDGALDLVERLRGVRYDWRAPADRGVGKTLPLPVGERQIGFIAQEVAAVVPEAVAIPKKGSDDAYALKEGALVPVLLEAVKEQQAEIKAQQAEIDGLKAQMVALRGLK
jgi:hypothetical protein